MNTKSMNTMNVKTTIFPSLFWTLLFVIDSSLFDFVILIV